MKIYILAMLSFLLSIPATYSLSAPASNGFSDRIAGELIEKSLTGRDGAYEAANELADCGGMYDALADHIDNVGGSHAMAVNLRNTSNSAQIAAQYFWQAYSDNSKLAMQGISESSKDYYAAILSVGGVGDHAIETKMFYCRGLAFLQAIIIDQMIIDDLKKRY